jgi:crotonobetainyl-CoA:carnitine CoA-transferase CaiB-like acyl-CoA transferase
LVRQRGLLVEYDHPELGRVRTIGPVLRLGDHRPEPGPAPRLGEHTEEVLARVGGLSAAELDRVRTSGASGSPRAVA